MTSKPATCAFTTDVEDYFQAESLRRFCPRESWDTFEDRTQANTERILSILDRQGVQGTFFVLGWTAERHPQLVRRIASMGHEVASHGYAHELIYRQSPQAFRDDVRKAKTILEDLIGQPVLGYRAPSYTIVKRTLWALPILAEEGYVYDSSVFPIKRRKYGMPGAPRGPFRHPVGDTGLVEFPLPALRLGPLRFPATGGAYVRLLPLGFQKWAIGRLLQENLPVVFNIHPWEMDPGQPVFPVGWRTRITHYTNQNKAAARVEALLQASDFHPLRTFLEDPAYPEVRLAV